MAASTITRLLTRAEAAEHLGISIERLDTLRTAGGGPEWGQWRGTIRYAVDELDEWLLPTCSETDAATGPDVDPEP